MSFLDRRKQFCSDRATTNLRWPRAISIGAIARMTKNKNEKTHTIWLSKEETPCHARSFLADNSLLLQRCHPPPSLPRHMFAAPTLPASSSIGFWDHWVPGANKASTDLVNEWAAKEKVEVTIDYIPSQGNKNLLTIAAEAQAKSGHDISRDADMVAARQRRTARRPSTTSSKPIIKRERRSQRHRQISRQGRRQMARRPRLRRQPDQGPLLAHRSDEEARRHRRAGDVSGRRRAEGRRLDHGYIPEGGRGLPQGRRSLRHRSRRDQRLRRHRRRVLPRRSAREVVDAKGNVVVKNDNVRQVARILQEADGVPAAGRRRRGTTRPTTDGWSPARAR